MKLGGGQDPSAITAEAFEGKPRRLGGAVISGELISYVVKKAAEDSETLKQLWKALDDRGLTPAAKKTGH